MWYLEILESGVYVINRVFDKIEDAMMTIGLRYSESEIKENADIQIHIRYRAIRKED